MRLTTGTDSRPHGPRMTATSLSCGVDGKIFRHADSGHWRRDCAGSGRMDAPDRCRDVMDAGRTLADSLRAGVRRRAVWHLAGFRRDRGAQALLPPPGKVPHGLPGGNTGTF